MIVLWIKEPASNDNSAFVLWKARILSIYYGHEEAGQWSEDIILWPMPILNGPFSSNAIFYLYNIFFIHVKQQEVNVNVTLNKKNH